MSFRVAIIGLGDIGVGSISAWNDNSVVLSHAHAVEAHRSFELVAGIDKDSQKRSDFARRFGVEAFESLSKVKTSKPLDLVVVSVPTDKHSSVFRETVNTLSPSFVLLEKPTSRSRQDDKLIIQAHWSSTTKVAVNYPRRVDPSFLAVQELIASEKFAPPFEGICWYTKGMYNSGSHFLDLLFGWLGEFKCSVVTSVRPRRDGDFDAEFTVTGDKVRIRFIPLDEDNFSHYSLELFSKAGRLNYDRGGEKVTVSFASAHSLYPDLLSLTGNEAELPVSPSDLMLRVYDDIYKQMKGSPGLIPSLSEAMKVSALLHSIAESSERF